MAEDRNTDETETSFAVKRARIDVHIGAYYQCRGRIYQIDSPSSESSVIGIDVETNLPTSLAIAELKPVLEGSLTSGTSGIGDPSIGDERWNTALKRFQAIRPYINDPSPGTKAVADVAIKLNVDSSTIYRWLNKYRLYRDISALCPKPRGWQKGHSRLNEDQDLVISKVINDFYLQPQRPSLLKTIEKVETECFKLGIKTPGPSAIRSRIAQVSERRKLRKRGQQKQADAKFLATPGHYPETTYPFEVVQIDHTSVDLSAVDETRRLDIGRFWATFAIDVYTRALVGLHLSLDAPSQTSVAMCMASMLTPKEKSFREKGINADLPYFGIPWRLHLDNGPEFHGDSFTRSCQQYGIEVTYRPVKVPRYGSHIERLIGTFMKKTHSLPGTTFSSIKEKGEYDSSKYSALTLADYEKWLIIEICKIYHLKHHAGIGMSPSEKWRRYFLTAKSKGAPLAPPRPIDDRTVLTDFLPIFDRTVQNNGVTIDDVTYYDDVLRGWIGATEPDNSKKKRLFAFRRDPRDISAIWFFDPSENSYFRILASSQPFPNCSIWEWNKVKKALALENPKDELNEEIIKARIEQESIVETAVAKTKKQRREDQRRRQHVETRRTQEVPAPPKRPEIVSSLIDDSRSATMFGRASMTSLDQSEFQHIAPAFRGVMSMSDEARLNFIEESRWIGYRAANNVISHLLSMMNIPKRPRMPNLLLIGDPHNGKTHILNQFKKLHGQAFVNDNNEPMIPVLIVQAPPGPVEKDLLIEILKKFSTPYRFSDPVVKLRHQAIHMLRHCNVKILIIDEVHSMLSGSSMSQRQMMTAIKYLCNELMIPIVCAGTRVATKIVSEEPQHASRFEAIELNHWNLDEDFRLLVSSFEQILPLKLRSNLRRKDTLELLYVQSRGSIGNLHVLLKDCAKHAICNSTEQIDTETIMMFSTKVVGKGLIIRRA